MTPLKQLHKGMGLYQVFYWPDKAPDKSKPYAVANLRTGDVNGRWHATKEEALSQARALYAKLGDKAKVQTEQNGIKSAFFFSADPTALLDGTADGVKWVEAIAPKTYTTPIYGDVVITSEKVDNFITNLNDNVRGQEIAINYEHGLDPAKGKKAAGWIRGARKNGSGNLELAVEFTEPAKEEINKKEWKYFSLEWDDEWLHPDGVIYADVVIGGALTNRPVAKNLIPINFSEIFSEMLEADTTIEMNEEATAQARSDPGVNQPIYDPESGQLDPGTGHFVPRKSGEPSDDPAIKNGWRRLTPPIAMSEDIFKFTEDDAKNFMQASATALDAYITEETTAEDRTLARGLLADTADLMDKGVIKYSEYTGHCAKVKKFFEKKNIEDKNTPQEREFSEAEAIGYLTASLKSLDRIHTNAGNALMERIEKVLNTSYKERSFSELQTLVNETRVMLRAGGDGDLDLDVTDSNTRTNTNSDSSKGGKTVGELTEKDLRELRNVLDVDDDGKILESVQMKFGELAQLRDAVSASEQERVFAEQYPQFYAEHRKMLERDRHNTAKDFSESISRVRKAEGLGLKTTKLGLSSLASEKLINAHMKFAEGTGTLDDFEEVFKAIMVGGLVEFGEAGSASEGDLPEIDTSTAGGLAASRKVFAEAIATERATNPELTYEEAMQAVASKHPDLASAYKVTLPA